jgi:hypothetical protein
MHPNILLDLARSEVNERVADAQLRSQARVARGGGSRVARFRARLSRRNCAM